jgi:uncharacterized membrane protein
MSTEVIATTADGGSDDTADAVPTARTSWWRRLLACPGVPGLALGLVFAWQSFVPTMMPRTWVAQGAITGVCLALGYMIGTFLGFLGKRLLASAGREPNPALARWWWSALAVGAAIVVVLAVTAWPAWQNRQRDLLVMEGIAWSLGLPMLGVAVVVTVILGVIGRMVGRVVGWINRQLGRFLPIRVVTPATVLVVFILFGVIVRDAVADGFASWANSAFSTVDTGTSEGTEQPTSPLVSGSPDSLAAWDTLGRQGRDFVAQATSIEQMAEFHGDGAELLEPIRVYVGLRTADTAEERAELAVRELERTGGFDREVLVVTTVTGTGWVDPDAALAIEMLYGGNTAIVAMQYSFLPSWIATLVDKDAAAEGGTVLFDTVHEVWRELPENDRPKLVVFGQSLGSYGAEHAFAGLQASSSIANMVARTDGVLYTGPTNDNPIWRQLIAERDEGSPVWRPVIDGGRHVRFFNSVDELVQLDSTWEGPRIVYVQHASDPVTFWGMDWLTSKPEWMDKPRGADVPPTGGWFPVVTWVQGVFDLMAGFGAPPGHGHDYRLAFAGAWSQVVPPEGWTSQDAARLSAFLNEG